MNRYDLKRIAAYCRVSTDKEDQANSFESQKRYFLQYINANPSWELYEIFADEGISGTNTKKRKGFNRMISCAERGQIDLILTKEISRFARNTLDSIYYTRELKKHGVGVIFLNDNINTLDGDAELRLAIMSSIAQEESRKTSERVKWGQKRRMEQGVVFGRTMLGYDVRKGRMYINEDGAKVVRLIFHKYVNEGKGTHVIARELLEEGIKPLQAERWQNTVILRILRNEKYCGDLIQKKTYTPDYLSHEKKYNHGQEDFVMIKDHHQPIISREMFDQATKRLSEQRFSQKDRTKYSNRYPFSGKIKCGCCGGNYVARYKKRKDGSQYRSWRCIQAVRYGQTHLDKAGNTVGCNSSGIRTEDLLTLIEDLYRSLGFNRTKLRRHLLSIITGVLDISVPAKDPQCLSESALENQKQYSRLIELYISDEITKDEFTYARKKYAAKKATRTVQAESYQREGLPLQITKYVEELIDGENCPEEFYGELLDQALIGEDRALEIKLKTLPHIFKFQKVDL